RRGAERRGGGNRRDPCAARGSGAGGRDQGASGRLRERLGVTAGRSAPDVVVVGAGVIGAACAYELARAGLAVTVVEQARPAAGASGASAGLLSAFDGGPLGALCRWSRDRYRGLAQALLEESGMDVHHEPAGHLELCLGDAEARWAKKLAAEHRDGPDPVEFVDRDGLRRLEPGVTPEARGALLLPRNGWVDPGR